MPTASNASRVAVLVVAAVGIVRILQAERHCLRRLTLQAAAMHQSWLSDIAENEKLRAAWSPPGDNWPSDTYSMLVHCNRQVSLLSAKFRAGLLDRRTLRVQARWLMEREIGRTYWREFGTFRTQEAKDRVDRAFNRILDDEYMAVSDTDTP
ncbi:DUF6082 family protein [Streptomyces sp. ICN988]|uniref:DUF6082 family protein n=1 Tax=unclassified Streptomyces TaxID=2593676 RepID=UPI0021E40B72|nr:DUF6082 family protein [Streptomyces sp. ICN988]MCV2459365.1 DUF6082 family protein [Streptomyces sp. ICN988]